MTYEPTDAEIAKLTAKLMGYVCDLALGDAKPIARDLLRHYEPRTNEQRCDSSGELAVVSITTPDGNYANGCPGCSRCKPAPQVAPVGGTNSAWLGAPPGTIPSPVAPVGVCDSCPTPAWCHVTGTREKCIPKPPTVTEWRMAEDQFESLIAVLCELQYERAARTTRPLEIGELIAAAKEEP